MEKKNAIILFQNVKIRWVWHRDEWWFSVVDIIGVLSGSNDPRNYWKVLKNRLSREESQLVTECNQMKMVSADGKLYLTDAGNIEIIFRLIQSIPSPNAEPFKRWLAKVGYERIQEIENPELAQERMKSLYEQKGYPKDWIDKTIARNSYTTELE